MTGTESGKDSDPFPLTWLGIDLGQPTAAGGIDIFHMSSACKTMVMSRGLPRENAYLQKSWGRYQSPPVLGRRPSDRKS